MTTVSLVDVTKKFDGITAINHINLEIHDGEYVCILGPTGSGKTTLLRLIAGVRKPDEGEICIDGKLVNDVPPQERGTAYVPQQYALFPHLRVIENVSFGPLAKGLNRSEATQISMQMLEMTRLAWRTNSFPGELSGGMQQRVALARGLASGAKLLLLDEPLGALDARLRVELRYRLRELARENNLTTIHVTHDQEEATIVADRIVVLRNGQIHQEGTPTYIYNQPKSIFVANFVGGANFLEGFISERKLGSSWVELRGRFRIFIKDNSHSVGERVVLAIREELSKISKNGEDEVNILRGTIKATSFLGDFMSYEVLLENGDTVNCKVPTTINSEKFLIGEEAFVQLKPQDIRVYPYPPAGLYKELEAL